MIDSVIITGATGFIGSHIVREFCSKGIKTTCFIRRESNLKNIDKLPVQIRYGNITDRKTVLEAFNSFSFVIHNAAYVRDWGRYAQFYETNVKGTLNVLYACVENGIENIIITGTNSVYGEEDSKQVKDENFPYNSHYHYFLDKIFPCKLNYYRDTKAMATREAVRYAQQNGLNLTILEPVWVYGEREFNTGFFEYIKAVSNGMRVMPGSKKNKFHVIYAGDLARAYYLAFRKKLKGINRIIIGNMKCERMDYIYSLFCKEARVKRPKLVPKCLVYPVGFILELIYTLINAKVPPQLTRGRVNMFYDNIQFSTERAVKLLGFINNYTLKEGIKKTVEWYKRKNLI